jgi:hypothetical protein
MGHELQRYLHDHLTGSLGADVLAKDLMERQTGAEDRKFFSDLAQDIERDREILKGLLSKAGLADSPSPKPEARRVATLHAEKDSSKFGTFNALEKLALAIQGKRLLWVVLGELVPWFPEWHPLDFRMLELEALRQRDSIEKLRVEIGKDVLSGRQCLSMA